MSDTDDTDDLLLIPPDFFILHSDGEDSVKTYGPYYRVVDSLITQVTKLEDRINCIETTSDSSFKTNSLDLSLNIPKTKRNFMSEIRRYSSLENIPTQDVYLESTHSTPQKPRTKMKLNSLPSTPNSSEHYIPRRRDIYSNYGDGDRLNRSNSSPNKRYPLHTNIPHSNTHYANSNQDSKFKNDEMLNEIDNFISNVKTIRRFNAARNLDKEFDSNRFINNSPPTSNIIDTCKPGLNLTDIDQMLHEMESHQREIESRLKEKEHELGLNRAVGEINENFQQQRTWQPGENKGSVPDRGMGMRDTLYKEQLMSKPTLNKGPNVKKFWKKVNSKEPDVQSKNISSNEQQRNKEVGTSKTHHIQTLTVSALGRCEPPTSDLSTRNSESIFSDTPSLSSSDSTQITAYHNEQSQKTTGDINNISPDSEKIHLKAAEVLNLHRNLLTRNVQNNSEYLDNNQKRNKLNMVPQVNSYSSQYDIQSKSASFKPDSSNTLALLSLSELWNQKNSLIGDSGRIDHSKFYNKLQEEKLRRRHCEQLIQELQTRTLELQERLAVAVQVDQAKDDAILQIHKSWEYAAGKTRILNKEITILEQQIDQLKTRTSHELSEAVKKIDHYETESSKALNLAHGNQERLMELEKQNEHFVTELQAYEDKLKTAESNYSNELNNTQQLTKILSQKEIELNECKNVLAEARKEVSQSKRAVEICQTELTSMKATQTQMEKQIDENLERTVEIEKAKKKLAADLELYKKIEKSLQDDLNKQKEANEKNKTELKNFYQDQVEIVVRDKLREFQAQLEKAENSLQDEIRKRELTIAKAAAIHIQQVTEKHSLEVHLLEEKHKEEVKLYKLQLTQAQQQIENLHIKLQQQQDKKTNIAQELHKIMEAQWLEAIKIINDGKSPIISQDKSTNTIDKLNYLKSRSYNNLEEILFKDDFSDADNSYDQISHSNNYQVPLETPIGRPQKSRQQIENELQKYVQMLLNKSPGNPTDEPSSKCQETQKNSQSENQVENRFLNLYGQQSVSKSK